MSVLPVGFGSAVAGGFNVERSLRFNSADSAYLNRTFTTPTDGKRWTWSGWVKRGILTNGTGTAQQLFSAGSATAFFRFSTTDTLVSGWTGAANLETTQVFRDASAWYHIMLVVDTTQATASNRVKYYVNGSQITAFSSTDYPTQNSTTTINSAVAHNIGAYTSSTQYFNGYLTEINFIDGQALTPSSFGETDSATGVWKPKAYSGTYGTNGFYLNFSDNSGTTSTTLGKDSSGNGNNWTPNNFSVTAGAGNDSLVDSPTAYGTDTGAGGEVRGNYATLNPLDVNSGSAVYVSDGNLRSATGAATHQTMATVYVNTGNFYAEATISAVGSVTRIGVGQQNAKVAAGTGNYALYLQSGNKEINGTSTAYGATFTTNDVIGLAYNATSGTLECFKNNVSQGTITLSPQGSYTFFHYGDSTSSVYFNFGQRPFAYTAPSGFKALCTQNLPTPTIGATSTTQANDYFNVVLYTGTGSTQSITGVGFQPDLIWIKDRSNARAHVLQNVLAGFSQYLQSNATDAETTASSGVTAVGADGFTVGTQLAWNSNTETYVAWNWKANGAGSSNTAGTITSTVSANTTSGFSIVTYTGTGANATVGHGLGVTPAMYIVKRRTGGIGNWAVWHTSLSNTTTSYILLDSTAAQSTSTSLWGSTAATSTTLGLGTSVTTNNSSDTYVAYCFAPVAGYSAFGSFVGNANADGPMVYLGFRPRWILIKNASALGDWFLYDTARNTYNVSDNRLKANLSDAEGTGGSYGPDILSNGFKMRSNFGELNGSGNTIIYAAFAETPAKFSLAR